jgi:lipoprotein NlpI
MNIAPALLALLVLSLVSVSNLAAETEKQSARELVQRGSKAFFDVKINESIKSFEQAISVEPKIKPQLWQLGIAYYYADRFPDGRDLFLLHQTVNSHDVENSVWHFLCTARIDGVEEARKRLIPISGDKRVPMKEVHSLFAGSGTREQVLAAASAVEGDSNRRNALCYAHLYLGLYEEALKNPAKSVEHMRKAAEDFSHDHYMGEVARVHLKLRTRQKTVR